MAVCLGLAAQTSGLAEGAPPAKPTADTAAGIASSRSSSVGVSRRRAFFLSLLLPGLGQRANGHYGRAAFFMGAEAIIWTSSATFKVVGKMREDDYRQFAAIQAGADRREDSEDYYQLVADYRSSEDYNRGIRYEAQLIFEDRQAQLAYIADHVITGEKAWSWPGWSAQREFQLLRHDALSANRTALLLTGWAVLNRVVSAIEAGRSARGSSASEDIPREEPSSDVGSSDGEASSRLIFTVGVVPVADRPAARIGVGRSF